MTGQEYVRHICGAGCFTDDLAFESPLFGHVLRSPHAHAKIEDIDLSHAKGLPGIVAIFTGRDFKEAGMSAMPCLSPVDQTDGTPMVTPPSLPLAVDKVRHLGEGVAYVVAETQTAAIDAAEVIGVEYSALSSVIDAERATADGAPAVWDEAPDNICFRWQAGDPDGTEAALRGAAHVVSRKIRFPRIIVNAIEPRAAVAVPEAGVTTLYAQNQGAGLVREQLATVLGCAEDELQVVVPDIGGSFGMKGFLYPEYTMAVHAARRLGRPVKWTGTRSADGFLADSQARDQVFHVELGLDEDARFVALRMRTVANLGARIASFGPWNSTMGPADPLPGPYAIPVAHLEAKGVFTNTLQIEAYRGAGRAEGAYPLERIVDAAARELDMDPVSLRERNFAQFENGSRTNCMGIEVDGDTYTGTLTRALSHSNWADRNDRKQQANKRGLLRGIGLCCYATTGMAYAETVRLEVDETGTVFVLVGTQSSGQGHKTVFEQALANSLAIEVDRVKLVQGDTRRVTTSSFTGGSRSISTIIPAGEMAARALIERGVSLTADLLQTSVDEIAYSRGTFTSRETGTELGFGALVSAAVKADLLGEDSPACLAAEATCDPGPFTFPSGCHVGEVEIDPATGTVRIVGYVSVDDIGRVQDATHAHAQVHGAVTQGIGQAVFEAARYDAETGQMLTGSLMDYALPRADDLPVFQTAFLNTEAGKTRGLGEMGTIAATPAIANAVIDALAQAGVHDFDIPATPERVWRALRKRTD